ncbi:ROK family transcriptional regulator [Nakamurella sp. PAMC28650]|uniref:ROK family transcriptional regulator n=1 Tax=Nakamurella sp. PAMC28650 TaxID=2762325 RepID=UPI00164CEB93|nr:ROK family transcriptional regulator [Nakamurella sp. PAMC28650]QNK81361.1 ROK family protein [Nakamurella sp. PAMC28650]
MIQFPAGDQGLLRSINERAVLEQIDRGGSATRADIASHTGLSKPTVGVALATLTRRGWIQETGAVTGRKGPVAALYSVRPEAAFAVGVDIGHDWIKVDVADITGLVRAHRRTALDRKVGHVAEQVVGLIGETARDIGISEHDIAETVVAVPGSVARDGRSLAYSDGIPDEGGTLGHTLAAAMPNSLTLENDVNLAALAERSGGLTDDVDDFVLLALGHGVGLGIVIGGALHRGFGGAAGEVGYLPTTRPSPHGSAHPALDEHIGSAYIHARAVEAGLAGDLSPRAVFAAARAGSAAALQIVRDTADSIAYTIACLTPILDPPLVILGGAIGSNRDLLQDRVIAHLAELTPLRPRIETSLLGADAVLIGATAMAVERARAAAFDRPHGSDRLRRGPREGHRVDNHRRLPTLTGTATKSSEGERP